VCRSARPGHEHQPGVTLRQHIGATTNLASAGSIYRGNRARDSERKRDCLAGAARRAFFFDTNRSIGRKTRPTRLHVALLTYASHVDRSSRLPAQRVQNISATLTCAAITTAAILESHSTIATDQARTRATPRGSLYDNGDILKRHM